MEAIQALPLGTALAVGGPAVAVGGLSLWFLNSYVTDQKRRSSSNLPPLPEVTGLPLIGNLLQLKEKKPHKTFTKRAEIYGPIYSIRTGSNTIYITLIKLDAEVPGLPLIGNLLQLKEKKPHKTFTKWAEIYGPIYSIRTGSNTMVVLNSNDVVKEATVTRFPAISTRKLSNALRILTSDKTMVAMSDYDEFHKTVKRHLLTNILGPNAQKQERHRIHRDTLIENTSNQLHALLKNCPLEAVNLKEIFESELFGLAMKQTLGEDVQSIHVDELGITMTRHDIFKCLVHDPMEGAIDVDWRDFFPYLKWIPNKSFENKIQQMYFRRQAVMKSMIQEQLRKRNASEEGTQCYLDYLQLEGKTLSEKQIQMMLWEVIIETSDTTLVATEWAMYELAKDLTKQDRLYEEISRVCGSEKITEERLPQLPYLYAVFQETLRLHSPVPIVPLRYVHEDTELGGFFVPSGSEIAINIYGCNMDKNVWEDPEQWKPERFLDERSASMDLHKTMAFGGGKRVCAGALEAMTISRLTIGRLVQEFEWRLKDGGEEDVDTLGLTARKLHPMLAFIKPRN